MATKAEITSPIPASVLAGPSQLFSWDTGTDALEYWFRLGSTGVGSADIYNASQALNLSVTVTDIPGESIPLYARLYTRFASGWEYNDYLYTAGTFTRAVLTSPVATDILPGPSMGFFWDAGIDAEEYWLRIGTTGVGAANVYNESQGARLATVLPGIALSDVTLYVRLFTRFGTTWLYRDYTFTLGARVAYQSHRNMEPYPLAGLLLNQPIMPRRWFTVATLNQVLGLREVEDRFSFREIGP